MEVFQPDDHYIVCMSGSRFSFRVFRFIFLFASRSMSFDPIGTFNIDLTFPRKDQLKIKLFSRWFHEHVPWIIDLVNEGTDETVFKSILMQHFQSYVDSVHEVNQRRDSVYTVTKRDRLRKNNLKRLEENQCLCLFKNFYEIESLFTNAIKRPLFVDGIFHKQIKTIPEAWRFTAFRRKHFPRDFGNAPDFNFRKFFEYVNRFKGAYNNYQNNYYRVTGNEQKKQDKRILLFQKLKRNMAGFNYDAGYEITTEMGISNIEAMEFIAKFPLYDDSISDPHFNVITQHPMVLLWMFKIATTAINEANPILSNPGICDDDIEGEVK